MRSKTDSGIKFIITTACLLAMMFTLSSPHFAVAAENRDYCVTPPYIGSSIAPNLLLMIDNSASMNDLNYVDKGTATRPATYCYDNTYRSDNTYAGYFKTDVYYDYDFNIASLTYDTFSETASFPTDLSCAFTLSKIANTLFVCYDSGTRTVTRFAASGQYLNWLTMSKFDIQKKILTGGKYDTVSQELIAESRGCVGHLFIKQPLTADYVEGGPNTALGVTFGISGPTDPYNPSSPSPGGPTKIEIFIGAYNAAVCQTAINDFSNSSISKETLITDIGACIGYTSTNKNTCQYNSSIVCTSDTDCGFSFTAGACGAVVANGTCGPLSGGACSTSTLGVCSHNDGTCPAVAAGVCVGGSKAGTVCSDNTPCKGLGTCTRMCVGGAKAGAVCGTDATSNNAVCLSSSCTTGDTSKASCSIDSDCNLKKCTNAGPKNGLTCLNDTGCDSGKCAAGKPATTDCLLNSDCNSATAYCTAGKSALTPCLVNTDCDLQVTGNGRCLPPASVQIKSTYGQSMHTCYQLLFKGQPLQAADLNTISGNNGCNSFYPTYKTCNGGSKDGSLCTGAADCPLGTCINGPNAIRPGSPVLICSSDYAGYCASSTNNWVTTQWNAMEYASADACVSAAITAYCGATQVPNVTDPTENASVTGQFANVPAILSDTGLQGQLGDPIAQMPVAIRQAVAPTGLLQQFDSSIRMGAMTFNVYGSPSECTTSYPPPVNGVACPKVCSTDPSRLCGSKLDCPFPATATCYSLSTYPGAHTCYYAGSGLQVSPVASCSSDTDCGIAQACLPGNSDGAKIVHYIGYGTCYDKITTLQVSPIVRCTTDVNCGANKTCKTDGAGSHGSGLINTIDAIKGASWTPFAEGFYDAIGYFGKMADNKSNTGLRINAGDFNEDLNPSQQICQKNNLLLISDGMSTADLNADVNTFAGLYTSGTPAVFGPDTGSGAACGTGKVPDTAPYQGSINLDNLAWAAKNRKISALVKATAITDVPSRSNESIATYVVLNGASNGLTGECNSETLLSNTAKNGGTTLQTAEDPAQLADAIKKALESIAAKAASGTAASVLASGEGSGANLIQAVFYPQRKFWNSTLGASGAYEEVGWTGRLSNLWYYVDPQFANSNIRVDDGDSVLNLVATQSGTKHDYIVSLFYDKTSDSTKAKRWEDPAGNGVIGTALTDVDFEQVGNLWEAGTQLWKRDVTAAAGKRKIYTAVTGTNLLAGNFSKDTLNGDADNSAKLRPYLQADTDAEAADIINWVHGVDVAGYRSRTVKIETIDTTPRVWKLGDIVNSTPKISSWMPLNTYNRVYHDTTYGPNTDVNLGDAPDSNTFITTAAYKARGMVFAGGNDGMVHAFKLGTLQLRWSGQGSKQVAKLVNPATGVECKSTDASPCGKEMWAFIPKNALPYLKYMADPNYCHMYSVDLTPLVFDASINGLPNDARDVNSWRTILIGGMRFGGSCKAKDDNCATNSPNGVCAPTVVDSESVGYSSYFALDVTDQNNPTLLWEFSNPSLGFATTGPAVVRINGQTGGVSDSSKNGNWFVVFGSGPTGPISTGDHQFMGTSDQSLKLFILDLKTGLLRRTVDAEINIPNAFAGALGNAVLDTDSLDYQDEIVYVPYSKKCTADTAAPSPFSALNVEPGSSLCKINTWTNGGVGRLSTKRDPDPANWDWSTVIDGVGPIASATTKIVDLDNNNLWLYFGTGRYYYTQQSGTDDAEGQRFLFGIKDPCFTSSGYNLTCTTSATLASSPFGGLTDVTTITNVPTTTAANASTFKGWYLALDPSGSYAYAPDAATNFKAERVITDPLASLGKGVLYFTTYKPYTDQCVLGGKSFIWALQYNTGGAPISSLKGKVLIQVSTGAIEQKDLATAFTDAGGRKSAAMDGKPPEAQGLSVLSQPKPTKRIIQMRER